MNLSLNAHYHYVFVDVIFPDVIAVLVDVAAAVVSIMLCCGQKMCI